MSILLHKGAGLLILEGKNMLKAEIQERFELVSAQYEQVLELNSELKRKLKRAEESSEDRRKSLDSKQMQLSLLKSAMRSSGDKAVELVELAGKQRSGYVEKNQYSPDQTTYMPKEPDYRELFGRLSGFVTASCQISVWNVVDQS